jgi:hypothetical protein
MQIPRLGWINGKTFRHSGNSKKNRSGLKPEHTAAQVENGLGRLASKEFDVRIGITPPGVVKQDIEFTQPIVPSIGQFADRNPEQGAAIDHSIATGEGLFA